MLTWHIGKTGMMIYRDGQLIAHIHPDYYPKLMSDMAREFSVRWDDAGRGGNGTA